jgi:hypothetical protein
VGPSIANIYVFLLETKWLNIYNHFYYKRYIDDLFLIAKNIFLKSTIESLRTSFRNLTLNLEYVPKVVFLDLNVEIDPLTKMLDFTLYT